MYVATRLSCLLLLISAGVTAQTPNSARQITPREQYRELLQSQAPTKQTLTPPNVAQLRAEDAEQPQQARFAAPMSTQINLAQSGQWTTLPDSSQVWRCEVQAEGAKGLILLFDAFQLAAGATVYANSGSVTLGPFTQADQTPSGEFTIGVLPGESAVLEYFLPKNSQHTGIISLNRVDYAYIEQSETSAQVWSSTGFGASATCNVNISCTQASAMQQEKKGIARILMIFNNGSAWCSGSLIGNTNGTDDPLFLTAHHCQILLSSPNFAQWTFYFDYEHSTCTNGPNEPASKTVVGCSRLAWRNETDMLLLRLNPIPPTIDIYYNGWSRSTTAPVSSTFIHHPLGDVKKFSADLQPALVEPGTINWGPGFGISPTNSHWKLVPDVGIFQSGSSGCPMFDQNKLIYGQLHGGIGDGCNITAAYFGMFNLSWNQGAAANARLRDWLDPQNTNPDNRVGYTRPLTISGQLTQWTGEPMANVKVALGGAKTDTVTTDAEGKYVIRNLSVGQNYTVRPVSNNDALNGLGTFDLVEISRHLLQLDTIATPWQLMAADANNNGNLSTFDVVELRKLILGVYTENLPLVPSWRFFPANTTFPNPQNPFSPNLPLQFIAINNLQGHSSNINFFGVKTGDMDMNAE
jgi:Carboxypeptidase regulatory-like domain